MYSQLREEPLKNTIAKEYFNDFKYQGDKIDFSLTKNNPSLGELNIFWAEAKKGVSNLKYSLIQLIITIGKHKYFTTPPRF